MFVQVMITIHVFIGMITIHVFIGMLYPKMALQITILHPKKKKKIVLKSVLKS